MLPSGRQRTFDNRVGWTLTYLVKGGLIERTGVARFRITKRGSDVLRGDPNRIDTKFLLQFPEFKEFHNRQARATSTASGTESFETSPEDNVASGYKRLRSALADELLERARKCSPRFFEEMVVELLVRMDYGGSPEDARAVGRSGDGGIDGVIKEDKLGLDSVYIQAKRWQSAVGRKIVAEFSGNLGPQKASKGVIITTSDFTSDAKDFAERSEKKIVLIDGDRLANLMIDYGVGVTTQATYEVKKVDNDYFLES